MIASDEGYDAICKLITMKRVNKMSPTNNEASNMEHGDDTPCPDHILSTNTSSETRAMHPWLLGSHKFDNEDYERLCQTYLGPKMGVVRTLRNGRNVQEKIGPSKFERSSQPGYKNLEAEIKRKQKEPVGHLGIYALLKQLEKHETNPFEVEFPMDPLKKAKDVKSFGIQHIIDLTSHDDENVIELDDESDDSVFPPPSKKIKKEAA